MEEARRCLVFDPRVGLALLVFANLAAFSEQPFWMEMIWIGFLLFLMLLHRCFAMAGKSLLIFGGILCLQHWILPAAPGWAATSFGSPDGLRYRYCRGAVRSGSDPGNRGPGA